MVSTINATPTNIVASVSGRTLKLQWPADHLGWLLQSNAVSLANSNFWFDLAASAATTLERPHRFRQLKCLLPAALPEFVLP